MFAALGNAAPKLPTRRALVVLNVQNDSFGTFDDLSICQPTDFVERLKTVISPFRKLGDLVWIKTEFEPDPNAANSARSSPRPDPNPVDSPATGTSIASNDSQNPTVRLGLENYFSSSRQRAKKRQQARPFADPALNEDIDLFEQDEQGEKIDDYLRKPRKGQPPSLYRPGSWGADFKDDIAHLIEKENDVILIKHHYSGFDATALLMTLRMKFVTHIYLAGLFSNVSIYETAADAVRHGFEVTVVEDCMGYRSEAKHIDAMRKMADFLGVSGVDSEEIIAEAGGQAPPDAVASLITGPGMGGINPQPYRDASQALSAAPEQSSEMEGVISSTQLEAEMAQKLDLDSHSSPSASTETPPQNQQAKKSRDPILLGPEDTIGEGDSSIIHNAMSVSLIGNAFKLIKDEVDWQVMHHRTGEVPRRVAVQGELLPDGSEPVYRHPADEAPPLRAFSKTVRKIRDELQRILKQPFNHVLIQLYRDGSDNISEHSDKTIDIVRGSNIVNVSLGAQRRMTLRTKSSAHPRSGDISTPPTRITQTVAMPHNSLFVLGWRTNAKWLHGVRPDKRPASEKTEQEKAFNGERISLTFRHIGTFLNADQTKIWGQGAISKLRESAGSVSFNDDDERKALIYAFGCENQQSDFDWDAQYGRGFDVLFAIAAKSTLFLCTDELANTRVKMCLFHHAVSCRITSAPVPTPQTPMSSSTSSSTNTVSRTPSRRNIFSLSPSGQAPIYRSVDPGSSEVVGDLAILFYVKGLQPTSFVHAVDGAGGRGSNSNSEPLSNRELQRLASNVFARITQANELLFLWQEMRGAPLTASTRATHQIRRLSSDTTMTGNSGASTHAPHTATTSATSPRSISVGSGSSHFPSHLHHQQLGGSGAATAALSSLSSSPPPPPAVSSSSLLSSSQQQQHQQYPQPSSTSSSLLHNNTTGGSSSGGAGAAGSGETIHDTFDAELSVWEEYAQETAYMAGDSYSIVDCALWPVLNEVVRRWEGWSERRFPGLADYWRKVGALESTRRALSERGDG